MVKGFCLSVVLGFFFMFTVKAQEAKNTHLYRTLFSKDSLLFNTGFNQCQIEPFENLISDNFEFYHDQGGLTKTKVDFILGIKNGLCKQNYQPLRILDQGQMEVYPLYNNGALYGAIQTGTHRFYAKEGLLAPYLTSTAKFTHVWKIENQEWKLVKGLSYDHKDIAKPYNDSILFKDKLETERWLESKQIPALGIGFINHGKIEQLSVFGNLETNKSAPLNTIWNVASLTKPITALVVLKLVNAGKWNLDEPLYHFYTDPDLAKDSNVKKLTTRLVLSHQTGLPNWRGGEPDGKLTFEFEPGTKYQYSGEGYEYLRKALEKKFKKSLANLASELIFIPLKMNDTKFVWDKLLDSSRFAKWHTKTGGQYLIEKNTAVNAADNLLTTVADYTKFLLHILNGAGLSEPLYKEMIAEQVRINKYKHFGLGWWIDENINPNKDFALLHGGDDKGVHTIVFIVPSSQKALLIFTNSDNGTDAFMDILLKYLKEDGKGILNIEMKQ